MSTCMNGHENGPEAKFCSLCGQALQEAPTEPTSQATDHVDGPPPSGDHADGPPAFGDHVPSPAIYVTGGEEAFTSETLNGTIIGEPRLATPGERLVGALLDGLLALVTLGIGWLIWSFFTFKTGQTPAKRILRMQVVNAGTTEPADVGIMAIRTYLIGMALALASLIIDGPDGGTFSDLVNLLNLVDALFIFTATRQRLIDLVLKTQVLKYI